MTALPDGELLPLETTLGHLVRRAQQVHTALFTAELGGELTGPQYAVLSALGAVPGLDQREAGRIASLDKSTTADVVSRLERNGWLRRRRDPRDARRNLLELTPSSRTALQSVTARVIRVRERLLGVLPAGEQLVFDELLGRVAYRGERPDTTSEDATTALALSRAPGHLLRRAEQVHATIWARRVGSLITPSQYAILSALHRQPPTTQASVGDHASLDKSSTADIVSRLQRRGLVTAQRDAADGRHKLLTLAPGVQESFAELTARVAQVQVDLAAPLDSAEHDALVATLRRIAYR